MFAFRLLGAGDSKFATVVALFASILGLPQLFIYMNLAGGAPAARPGTFERGVSYVAIAAADAGLILAPAIQRPL
jgi:Flp pilus assembly protein protease CpaA